MPDDLVITEEDVGLPARRPNLNPFQLAVELEQLLSFQEDAETEEEIAATNTALAEYVKRAVEQVDPIRGYLLYSAMMARAAKEERDRQSALATAWQTRHDRVKDAALLTMRLLGQKKLTGKTGQLVRKGNGGKQPVVVSNPDLLPPELLNVTVTMPLDVWQAVRAAVGDMLVLPDKQAVEPSLSRIGEALNDPCEYCIGDGSNGVGKDCHVCGGTGLAGVPGASFAERGEHIECR